MKMGSRLLIPALFMLFAVAPASHAETSFLPLRDNVGVTQVEGGDAANPRWGLEVGNEEFRGALRHSLDAAGLLERARGEGRYQVSATIVSGDLPSVGVSLTVTTNVRYTLTDRESGDEVFRESLAVGFTTDPWDSILNVKRLQSASRGAVRASANKLAEALARMNVYQ